MSGRFEDQVVLVTGAGSGIGQEIARAFAREGAVVVASGRTTSALEQTVRLIEADGGRAQVATADVADSQQVQTLVANLTGEHGRLDVAVNNAGIVGTPGPLADADEAMFAAVVATNLTGMFLAMKHEIRFMREHGGGAIVNLASNIGAHARRPGMAAYAATKAAVSALTRAAARDHIADGIRINAVSPGATDTTMSLRPGESDADRQIRLQASVPLGRVGGKHEVAAAVLWLASGEASFAVGHDLVIDGGATA